MRKSLKNMFYKRPDEFDKVPEGVCPNCWGDQEYGNVVREKYKDVQIEVDNRNNQYAFVQDFVVTHLKRKPLKSKVNGLECPTYHVIYTDEIK